MEGEQLAQRQLKASDMPWLHQIWFQGQDSLPPRYHSMQRSWQEKHPQWRYRCWSGTEIERLIEEHLPAATLKAYRALPSMIQRIDFGKVVLLFLFAGAYVDMDCLCLQPLDPLLQRAPVVLTQLYRCKEGKLCPAVLFGSGARWCTGPMLNNSFFLCSQVQHPFWWSLLEHMAGVQPTLMHALVPQLKVINTTGPNALTACYRQHWKDSPEVHLLSPEVVEPFLPQKVRGGKAEEFEPGPENYAVHFHHNTWTGSGGSSGNGLLLLVGAAVFALLLAGVGILFCFRALRRSRS